MPATLYTRFKAYNVYACFLCIQFVAIGSVSGLYAQGAQLVRNVSFVAEHTWQNAPEKYAIHSVEDFRCVVQRLRVDVCNLKGISELDIELSPVTPLKSGTSFSKFVLSVVQGPILTLDGTITIMISYHDGYSFTRTYTYTNHTAGSTRKSKRKHVKGELSGHLEIEK